MHLTLTFTGKARFFPLYDTGQGKLLVAIRCRFGPLPPAHALLDTAAQWSVLPPDMARQLGFSTDPDPDIPRYLTRFGPLQGRLETVEVAIPADSGETVRFDAPFFISDGWEAPPVIGWASCLEFLPFALDPRQYEEYFYFCAPAEP